MRILQARILHPQQVWRPSYVSPQATSYVLYKFNLVGSHSRYDIDDVQPTVETCCLFVFCV